MQTATAAHVRVQDLLDAELREDEAGSRQKSSAEAQLASSEVRGSVM